MRRTGVRIAERSAGEQGYALIVAMMVSSIMMVATLGMLATGMHLTTATVKDASWNDALQVAEAGLDRAMYELGANSAYTGTGSGTYSLPKGEAQVLVTSSGLGSITVYSTGWSPSRTASNASHRRIKAVYGPENAFDFALFSTTGLSVKNNGVTHGDVFANNSILLEDNSTVDGSVTSATGTVQMQNNAAIRVENARPADVHTGGYDATGKWGLSMANGSVVEGNAFAEAETCPGTTDDDGRYSISANGTIQGDATARGSISGGVLGARTPFHCNLRASTRVLPQFTWDPSLYTSPQEFTSLSTFQSWVDAHQTSMSGVVRLWDPSCASDPAGTANVVNMNGANVTDDFVMVTNCRIDAVNNFTVSAPSDSIVDIVVQNASTDPSAVTIKNNFTVVNGAAVLLYSTGLITVKNNIEEQGAVYAGAISIKNNMEVAYDPRVQRTLGFGDLKYDRISWQECGSTSTGTSC